MKTEEIKDLNYYNNNASEDYMTTPISVLRYIGELETSQFNQVKQVEDWDLLQMNYELYLKNIRFEDTILSFIEWAKIRYAIPKEESKEWRTKLFNYMDKEHSVQLLDSDMNDIQHICFPPDYPYTH